MKAALIGVGQAGGKITQAITEYDWESGFQAVEAALAVNTAKADLQSVDLDSILIGRETVKGNGVGGDNELGAELMQNEASEVLSAIDSRVGSSIESILVIAGLGGGTGSGGAPVLVNHLRRVYELPVYGLGIIPGRNEGAMYQANAARSLLTLVRESDSALLIHNDNWRAEDETIGEGFDSVNTEIARRIGLLLGSGEAVDGVGESVVDSSEVINTLRSGGLAAIGYASAHGSQESAVNINTIMSLTRRALLTDVSIPNATSANAGLLVIAGRPETISRRGMERARHWMEEETGCQEIRGGDFPLDDDRLAALVLLGGIERSDWIDDFLEQARRVREGQTESKPDPAAAFETDELTDLF